MRAILLAVLAAFLVAPSVAGQEDEALCIITFSPEPGFHRVEMAIDLILSDEDRANASRGADANGDGELTAAEVTAYEQSTLAVYREGDMGLAGIQVLRDTYDAPTVTVYKDLKGFEGRVNDTTRKLAITEVRTYEYSATTDRTVAHQFTGGANLPPYAPGRPVIETMIFTAPEGWKVWQVNGTEHMRPSVTIRGFDTHQPWSVTYLRDGTDPEKAFFGEPQGGPAAGAIAAAAVALAAAWTARRRA